MMPLPSRLLAAAIIVPLLVSHAVPAHALTDIRDSFYRHSIQKLLDKRVLSGYDDDTFRPKNMVNRAEMMKIVMNAAGDILPATRRCFPDVDPRAWYADYVCTGKERNVVQGYHEGNFRPDATVNFAEALKITLTAFRLPVSDASTGPWYAPYTDFAHEQNILSRHTYLPWQEVTRERMAEIVQRAMDYKENPSLAGGRPLSRGCAQIPPSTPPSRITVSGIEREYLLHVPGNYRGGSPKKLIFAFHGRTNSNGELRRYLELERYGPDYMVVYPSGLESGNGGFTWQNPGDPPDALRDFALFDELVREIGSLYCIDLDHIHVVGYSLGAVFANALGCARGDMIRAIATLGGSGVRGTCPGPVAAMVLHNPNDRLAPFAGGEHARNLFLEQNSCDPAHTQPVEPREYNCIRYAGCADGNPVVWCPHEKNHASWDNSYYPHNWPAGTAQHIFTFFHSLR